MQRYSGASAAQLHDFHLTPGDAVQAGAQSLADSFLSGKTPGEASRLATALAYLHFGIDTFEETLVVMLVDLAHSIHLDDIDAYSDIHTLWRLQMSGGTCPSRWSQKHIWSSNLLFTTPRPQQQTQLIHPYLSSFP